MSRLVPSRKPVQAATQIMVLAESGRPTRSGFSHGIQQFRGPRVADRRTLQLLLDCRAKSEFNRDSNWVWASPFSAGEMPLYFNAIQRDYIIPAAIDAGLGKIGWHTLRHTHRSWLNAAGTPLGVQKDLMRRANISTTTGYGTGVVEAMRQFNSQVVKRVIQ